MRSPPGCRACKPLSRCAASCAAAEPRDAGRRLASRAPSLPMWLPRRRRSRMPVQRRSSPARALQPSGLRPLSDRWRLARSAGVGWCVSARHSVSVPHNAAAAGGWRPEGTLIGCGSAGAAQHAGHGCVACWPAPWGMHAVETGRAVGVGRGPPGACLSSPAHKTATPASPSSLLCSMQRRLAVVGSSGL